MAVEPRRALLVSPHFPPDPTAGAHRTRVLAPYLARHGYVPTVLTVAPEFYEGRLDDELARALPADLEIVRCRAVSSHLTRRVGVGDLGLRALPALRAESRRLLSQRHYDVIFLTTYPVYPALLGPRLGRRYGVPVVIDLQDPWVGAWGDTVGGGPGGAPDVKSRASRGLAARIERYVMPRADALTSVSSQLLDELAQRYPAVAHKPREVLPIGFDLADLDWISRRGVMRPRDEDRSSALTLNSIGTLLPLGFDTLNTVLDALATVAAEPGSRSVRARFVGTSNQSRPDMDARVLPLAARKGIVDLVDEQPSRVPYFDALRLAAASDALLLLGTSEPRYTASRLHVALAAGRPLLAVFHEASDVAAMLRPLAARDPAIALVTYGDAHPVASVTSDIANVLRRWRDATPAPPRVSREAMAPILAPALAGRLAALFDRVAAAVHA